jgi:hypothetical protein
VKGIHLLDLIKEKYLKFGITLKKLDGNPKAPRAASMYCGKDYACHTILNGTSNMWSNLGVCKKIPFVIDQKHKTLVLEPMPIRGKSGDY